MTKQTTTAIATIKAKAFAFAKQFDSIDGVRIAPAGVHTEFITDTEGRTGVKFRVPMTTGNCYIEACCFHTDTGDTLYSLEHAPATITDQCDWIAEPVGSLRELVEWVRVYEAEHTKVVQALYDETLKSI